jgi:HEPN domain-containing protein
MKGQKNSLYPPDWMKYARKDWRRIFAMLNDNDIEGAAFFIQQALEKYLKAFMLQRGWLLRKIHDLDALLDDATEYNPSLESFRTLCKRVSGYYLIERYPAPTSLDLDRVDIEKDIEEAKEFVLTMFADEELKDA